MPHSVTGANVLLQHSVSHKTDGSTELQLASALLNYRSRRLLRMKKISWLFVIILVCALGLLTADQAKKKREFKGTVTMSVCAKGEDGKWSLVDKASPQQMTFVVDVADMAAKKQVMTNHNVAGRTDNGHQFQLKTAGSGDGEADLTTGFVAVKFPVSMMVDGKTFQLNMQVTTDSVMGPTGANIQGKRAVIDHNAHTAQIAFVGSTEIMLPDTILQNPKKIADMKLAKKEDAKAPAAMATNVPALVVLQADGMLKALD